MTTTVRNLWLLLLECPFFSVEWIYYRPRIIAYIFTLGKFPVADVEN
jgi:hypothetical protein